GAAKAWSVPSDLIAAVMKVESSGNPDATSPAGAMGLMQFMPKTAKDYGIEGRAYDPKASTYAGAHLLSDLMDRYGGDIPKVLAAYNWGPGNLDQYGLERAPKETRNYIKAVKGYLDTDYTGGSWDTWTAQERALEEAQDDYKRKMEERKEIEAEFWAAHRETMMSGFDLERYELDQAYKKYQGVVQDKAALDQWYSTQLQDITKREAEARAEAQDKAIRESREFTDGAARALRDYADVATNAAENAASAFNNAFSSMEDALVSFVTTGEIEFDNFINAIIADFARLMIRQNITGPLAQALAGVFGGGTDVFSAAENIGLGGLGLSSAHGNVFSQGRFVPFAHGGLITRPTLFPFAQGGAMAVGLAGEAGEEAIMPLARNAQGDLGVIVAGGAAGGGPSLVRVELINQSGQPLRADQAQATFNLDEMVITIVVDGLDTNRGGLRDAVLGASRGR
ncbi:MAG: transglycosylase SLT domain-containing protein, partial [Thermodesulfobacteriota bacterium]